MRRQIKRVVATLLTASLIVPMCYGNKVSNAEMVKKNVISEEQARLSAQSNVILKALGVNPDIEVEIAERPYQKGDRFILCTDGFWGAMPEDEFVRHLTENNPINKILDSTANIVESIGRNSGNEYDNPDYRGCA